MEIGAIILLAGAEAGSDGANSGGISSTPYGLIDVLGAPVAYRVVDRLRRQNITSISVITDADPAVWPAGTADTQHGVWTYAKDNSFWRSAEQAFSDLAQSGAELILVYRLGAYAEIDFDELVQFHLDRSRHITRVVDENADPLDVFAISASRRNDAAYLFRHRLTEFRAMPQTYVFAGYANPLQSPRDLRDLAVEGLMQRIEIEPVGRELKPGVWVGRGVHLHRRARVLSPAYIGAGSRVCASAVITRCTALERYTVVDCGTVVENVSTLPHTYLGAGLDIAHCVVGHRWLWSLKRDVAIEFSDSRLIGNVVSHAPLRALSSLASLISFVPVQFVRGLLATSHREEPASIPPISSPLQTPAPVKATSPAVEGSEFPGNFAVARRYGGNE